MLSKCGWQNVEESSFFGWSIKEAFTEICLIKFLFLNFLSYSYHRNLEGL
jgi:hypothetical protein